MYKTLEDCFNSKEAVYNDPLYEIHNPITHIKYAPEIEEYMDMLNNINDSYYPSPTRTMVVNIVNPNRPKLKSVYT